MLRKLFLIDLLGLISPHWRRKLLTKFHQHLLAKASEEDASKAASESSESAAFIEVLLLSEKLASWNQMQPAIEKSEWLKNAFNAR